MNIAKKKTMLVLFLIAIGFSFFYYFNCYAHADSIAFYGYFGAAVDFGIKNLGITSPLQYLNLTLDEALWSYLLFGHNWINCIIPLVINNFICMMFAFYLISENKASKIWALWIYCFLMMPSFAFGIQVSIISDPYKIMWWKYTHPIPVMAVMLYFIVFHILEKKNMNRFFKLAIMTGTLLLLTWWTFYCVEGLLFIECAWGTVLVYAFMKYYKVVIRWIIKKWYTIVIAVILLFGPLGAIVIKWEDIANRLVGLRGAQYITFDFSVKTITDMAKLALVFFDAHDYGKGIIGNNPLYLLKIVLLLAGIGWVIYNCVVGMIDMHKVNSLTLLISVCVMVNLVAGVITGTGMRYGQPTLYLLGIVLCRNIADIIEKYEDGHAIKTIHIWVGRIAVVCCVVFLGFGIANVYQTRENLFVNSNTSDYQACMDFNEYARHNNLHYGFSELGEIDLMEIMSNGNVTLTRTSNAGEGNPFNVSANYLTYIAGNYTNFYLDSTIYDYGGITSSDVLKQYGDYVDKQEYYNALGEPYADLYVYDYDIRTTPFSAFPEGKAHRNTYDLYAGENLEYIVPLDMGTYRLELNGNDLSKASVLFGKSDKYSATEISKDDNLSVYEINCLSSCELNVEIFNTTDHELTVSKLDFYCTYAAVDLEQNGIMVNAKENVEYDFVLPEESFRIIVTGTGMTKLDYELIGACEYELETAGRCGAILNITNASVGEKVKLSIQNSSRKQCEISKIEYEISLFERMEYPAYSMIIDAENADQTSLTLMPGGHVLRVEGENLNSVKIQIGYYYNGEFYEFESGVIDRTDDYTLMEFYVDNLTEGVQIVPEEVNDTARIYSYCID